MTCEIPTDPKHGQVIGHRFYYANSIRYKCNVGFQIVGGDETRNCSEVGHWTGNPASCGCMLTFNLLLFYNFSDVLLLDMCNSSLHTCPPGQTCAVSTEGKVLCLCKSQEDCPHKNKFVCGSDGETYLNRCWLLSAACRFTRSHVKSLFQVSTGVCSKSALISQHRWIVLLFVLQSSIVQVAALMRTA